MSVSVKLCECCANNEIVQCCDVVAGHMGRAVGRAGGGAAGPRVAAGARADAAR